MVKVESNIFFRKAGVIIIFILVFSQSFLSYSQPVAEKQICNSLLPKEVSKEIIDKFKGWHVLSDKDLIPDDQKIWEKTHQGECPGIAKGKYKDSKNVLYAVLILYQEQDK